MYIPHLADRTTLDSSPRTTDQFASRSVPGVEEEADPLEKLVIGFLLG
jgi:hypothetical protein